MKAHPDKAKMDALNRVAARRSVDDHALVCARELGELACDGAVANGGDRQIGDIGMLALAAAGRPGHGAGLRIGVDKKRLGALPGEIGGNMQGKGGFTRAALLIDA